MKRTFIRAFLSLFVAVTTASATIVVSFTSWDYLIQRSSDIVIARCTATTPNPGAINGMIHSEIEVTTVLKGNTTPAPAKMVSQYWPHQGERFLLFSIHTTNKFFSGYSAVEEYRIVPIDHYFRVEDLAGKPLTEQIQLILARRLTDVRKELERATEEKNRLEQSLNK